MSPILVILKCNTLWSVRIQTLIIYNNLFLISAEKLSLKLTYVILGTKKLNKSKITGPKLNVLLQ